MSAIIPVVPIQTTAPPISKMGWYTTKDPPITCTDCGVHFRSLLRRIPRLDLHYTVKPATQRINKL